MSYEYKNGYKRNVTPKSFSIDNEIIVKMKELDWINWSRVVNAFLTKFIYELPSIEIPSLEDSTPGQESSRRAIK